MRRPSATVSRLAARLLCAALLTLLAGCDAEPALQNATRFVARMSCSCVFVSGRELPDCIDDLPGESASLLRVAIDQPARRITARALWIEGSAAFEEGKGCTLLD